MLTKMAEKIPSRVTEVFGQADQLTGTERLTLARLLLESVLASAPGEETEWAAMSLSTLQKDWDNSEDAVYDNWRECYGVSAR